MTSYFSRYILNEFKTSEVNIRDSILLPITFPCMVTLIFFESFGFNLTLLLDDIIHWQDDLILSIVIWFWELFFIFKYICLTLSFLTKTSFGALIEILKDSVLPQDIKNKQLIIRPAVHFVFFRTNIFLYLKIPITQRNMSQHNRYPHIYHIPNLIRVPLDL